MVKINRNPAVCIILDEKERQFLMNIYTPDYRLKMYVGAANLIGGGKDNKDKNTFDTIKRELTEELPIQVTKIILKYIKKYGDFFVNVPKKEEEEINSIINVFISKIPQKEFYKIKRIINSTTKYPEGKMKIFNKKDLITKIPLTGATCLILSNYLEYNIKNRVKDDLTGRKL